MADIEIRTFDDTDDDAIAEFGRVINGVFGGQPAIFGRRAKEAVRAPGRRLVAYAGDDLVGTAGAFTMGLTVPGGRTVPVAGVSAVSVQATHRRRGILRKVMARQLDYIVAAGEAIAVLNASEAAIYRRFGYGVASWHQGLELDTRRALFRERAGDDLDLRLFTPGTATDAHALVAAIYERWRPMRPGTLVWNDAWFDGLLGAERTWLGGGPLSVVVCEPGDGHGGGYALYTIDRGSPGEWTLDARHVVADDPVVEARLWRYLLEVDLIGTVRVEMAPLDTPLRWLITDPRQVRVTEHRDWLHVRVLDVVAALTARTYARADDLVIDVVDAFRDTEATNGRFRLSSSAAGEAACERLGGGGAGGQAALPLDIAALGSLFLGGVSVTELAAAGLVSVSEPDGLRRADALFRGDVVPFCVTHF